MGATQVGVAIQEEEGQEGVGQLVPHLLVSTSERICSTNTSNPPPPPLPQVYSLPTSPHHRATPTIPRQRQYTTILPHPTRRWTSLLTTLCPQMPPPPSQTHPARASCGPPTSSSSGNSSSRQVSRPQTSPVVVTVLPLHHLLGLQRAGPANCHLPQLAHLVECQHLSPHPPTSSKAVRSCYLCPTPSRPWQTPTRVP